MSKENKDQGDFAVETDIADQAKMLEAAKELVRIMARQTAFDDHSSCGNVAEGGF